MLKALELSGFKSFADRTQFDFPQGISVVVGPNGSGKSNLVDAVKWVLGSQSAKSLRGKEMTDVIFNGAASRGPMGTGEATLTLDNSDRRLPIDAAEVHITRRVYRSGEGEYLINREPCRLRDIRELLAGTGITTEAYCIIEQGRVDALLQSSPRERRVIFEEAAGISQFKMKKAAAMRRLERVEQNLLRLSDIVDEVESRLRSVRAQAGKARRYREHAARLEFLRTQLGLVDWQRFSQQIAGREEQAAALRRRQAEHETLVERCEAALAELEQRLASRDRQLREIEATASAAREQIATRQAVVENLSARRGDLELDVARLRRQLLAMTQPGSVDDVVQDATAQFHSAENAFAGARAAFQEQLGSAQHAKQEFETSRHHWEQLQAELAEAVQSQAAFTHALKLVESQLAAARIAHDALQNEIAQLRGDYRAQSDAVASCRQAETELTGEFESHRAAHRAAEQRLAQVRRESARADKQHHELESQLARTRERIAVLMELENRLEGLDSGVQDVLRLAREAPDGQLADLRGIVADLFHVDMDTAPLVELALGERAQYLVLASASRLFDTLDAQPLGIAGRVGFLRLDAPRRAATTALDHVDLSTEMGVMGRADRYVEAAPEIAPLVNRILGRTWFVDRLSTAMRLAQAAGRGLEFVTASGELLTADGTLVIGARQAATGMLSRRSELRACHEQVAAYEGQLQQQQAARARWQQQQTELDQTLACGAATQAELVAKLAECRERNSAARVQLEHIVKKLSDAAQRLEAAEAEINANSLERETTVAQQAAAQQTAEQLRARVQSLRLQLPALERRAAELSESATEKQIAAAKCEERVEMLRAQADQAARDQQQRDESLADTRQQIAHREAQLKELDAAMLAGRQALAELFLEKERHAAELAATLAADESLRRERAELSERVRAEQRGLAGLQTQLHKLEVSTNKLRHELETLCERMQDDYGIDLAAAAESGGGRAEEGRGRESFATGDGCDLSQPPVAKDSRPQPPLSSPFPGPRDAVEREIAELRSQLNNIGAVNLDALDELDDLESRFGSLSGQYRDLVDAKASLERIVQRINGDSRQIFLATLEMVRGHFQELFRRLFGGGEADIIVDDAEDILECGIEIVARPPGKEACSISLLSGGEKTLTCVALLLAVFRSKPSPFCVLDEVDAALDEANIGRFIQVLREFLSFTQFIVVSHSKRTMAGADTLYGVTMEESGVSKRVSVRFEDVSEDGHILPSALHREPAAEDKTIAPSTARRAA